MTCELACKKARRRTRQEVYTPSRKSNRPTRGQKGKINKRSRQTGRQTGKTDIKRHMNWPARRQRGKEDRRSKCLADN
jgi:hypothetical protein